MTIKKQYLKSNQICKVTFAIPPEVGQSAKTVKVVGEFNNWSFTANPMKKLKSGAFKTTIDLIKGREYQFRYLMDKNNWENETETDKLVPSPYGDSENSVVIV